MENERLKFKEFKEDYFNDVNIESQYKGMTPSEYFFEDSLNQLSSMGEIIDPIVYPIEKETKKRVRMSMDAYAFDEAEKSLILIAYDFSNDLNAKINNREITAYYDGIKNFLFELYMDTLTEYFDKFAYADFLNVCADIRKRLNKDYVSIENDDSIDKIKLYLITNRELTEKTKGYGSNDFQGKKISYEVWHIKRFFDVYTSRKEKETIYISTKNFGVSGIPCIKADMKNNTDYDAYLAIIPGELLQDIYYEYGSRILEGNVRSFLSNRGKINKGIRKTIKEEPTKFFTYNNGIACTAKSVKLSKDERYIEEMEDLQIINGGQTTASLTSAKVKDKYSLENIFIPMKLTVIKNSEYDLMIQNIAKYANSQNKVTDADLFSNHPFHRVFEDLSKKYQAPVKEGELYGTYWFYERSRGKYEQEQIKFTKKSEKDEFKKRNPKNQVIKKEELAKYFVAADLMRPDIVSKGSQKAMNYFAEYIDKKYETSKEVFNEDFYKRLIAYTILYKRTDIIVNTASWYNKGGYKLNIVPYTVAKVMSLIPNDKSIDYYLIWKTQDTYPALNSMIEKVAKLANDFIIDSHGVIVTEYCKKEDTWNRFKDVKITVDKLFVNSLINKEIVIEINKSKNKEEKYKNQLLDENELYKKPKEFWEKLLAEGKKMKLITDRDESFINLMLLLFDSNPKIPSEKQMVEVKKIVDRLFDEGVLI